MDARSLPFPELLATSDVKGSAIRVLPSGTFLMTSRTCWTPDGKFGTCSSVRSCYPNLKLASANDLDSLILSVRGTCLMTEPDGKQVSIEYSNSTSNNPITFKINCNLCFSKIN